MFNTVMLQSKKEKEKLVVKLAIEGMTTRGIGKEIHIFLRSIGQMLNKVTGDYKDDKEQRLESPTVICYYEN
jgi:hypothetical protein